MVGATVSAPGPEQRNLPGPDTQPLQGLCRFHCPFLGFDQRIVTIVDARATDRASHRLSGTVGKRFQQRLRFQCRQAGVRHVRYDQVLPGGDADFAVAVGLRQVCHLPHLSGGNAAHRHAKAHVVQPRCALREHADVIGAAGVSGVHSGAKQRPAGPGFYLGAETFGSPFSDEERQTHLVAGFARAVVAESQRDVAADFGGFLR